MTTIDIGKVQGEISPLWFGHNLEHSRSCIWHGLSAQLIRNRKFAGPPERNGIAKHWYGIGLDRCWWCLDYWSKEPYTSHFDSEINMQRRGTVAEMQQQKMQALENGKLCGIGQKGIFLEEGKEYETRIALRSDREIPVKIQFLDQTKRRTYYERNVLVRPGNWKDCLFFFAQPETDPDVSVEFTFERTGTLSIGSVSLLPADHWYGMRRDVVELLKEIPVPILRWPGGNFAGDYRWKDGLLPRDQRAPLKSYLYRTLPHTDGYDNHEIGTDEFIVLCRELGAEPYITINMSLEGPEEAAGWVEYCNGSSETGWGRIRAKRGQPEPYNVRFWSLGNEMGYGHMKGPNSATEYAQLAMDCAKAMRNIDSSIVLTACGTFGKFGRGKDSWDSVVISKAGKCFDHISYHSYARGMNSYLGAESFRRVANASERILESLKEARVLYNAHAPDGKNIGISFDEWNVWYSWYRVPGVAEGIYTASMLNMLCREGQNVGIVVGAYFEPVNEGGILVSPKSAVLTAAGQVFSLFKFHHGNQLIRVELQAEEAISDLAASVNTDRQEVVITIVNRSPNEKANLEFALENLLAIENVEGLLLSTPHFLPGSVFGQQPLDLDVREDHTLRLSLPRHSVARIVVHYS